MRKPRQRLGKYNLILLGLSWGMIAIAAKPTIAQTIEADKTLPSRVKIASLLESERVSTSANDLLLPAVELREYFTDLQTRTYQLGQLDLEKFCQDFPYNSRCGGNTPSQTDPPGMEREPSSIPVPVPPPAPPEESESRGDRQEKSGWAIVPEISTLGLGGHVVRRVIPQINARVGINAFSLGLDGIDTDIDYEADLNLFNVSTLVDFHPFRNSGIRLSGGLIFGNNNFDATGDVSELVTDKLEEQAELNEETVERLRDIDDLATVDAEVEITNGVSPYLGIGGGNAVGRGKGLGFWWNLGVVFSGSPDIDLGTDLSTEQIRAEFENESDESAESVEQIIEETQNALDEVVEDEENEIEDALDFVNIYPVFSLGISYQF